MPTQAISLECLARYGSAAVPRYTSYPTAPHFNVAVGEEDYRAWLGRLAPDTDLSVYVHVPFCRSMCWYCGCHTTVTGRSDPVARYMAAMEQEIALIAEQLPARFAIQHLHFGGGTPTLMGPDLFARFMAALRARFDLVTGVEIAVEVDPRTLTSEMTAMLGAEGVTRASLGVQSFDPRVQHAINRVQTYEETEAAVAGLRRHGVGSINLDLIYGLPHQDVESCIDTVQRAVTLRPDRLSVFGYAHVPSFKRHQRKIDTQALPDLPNRWAQFQAIADALVAAGYVQVGLDHFALPDDALAVAASSGKLTRNFQGYTTDAAPALIGLGASAIGQLPQGYVQNAILISDYQARVADGRLPVARGYKLSRDDRLRSRIIARLMCDYEVDIAEVCAPFGADPDVVYPTDALARMEDDGLVERLRYAVRVLPAARPLVRSVAAAFDAHLAASAGRHARAV